MALDCSELVVLSLSSNRRRIACGGEPTVADQRLQASLVGSVGEDMADAEDESVGENKRVLPVAREKAVHSDSHVAAREVSAGKESAGGSA